MGAIDFDNSDLEKVIVESGPRSWVRQEAQLIKDLSSWRIVMRRAVKEFDFLYDYEFNTLIVSPQVFSDFQSWIEPSVRSFTTIICQFGARERPYLFGNLVHANCLKQCLWERSRFATAYTSTFDINQTEIENGEVPLTHEVPYVATNQTFSGMEEYYAREPSLHRHIPERLAFSFGPCDIINIGIGKTLISRRLFEALWDRQRPKSRVLGMTGSRPLVKVEFGVEKESESGEP